MILIKVEPHGAETYHAVRAYDVDTLKEVQIPKKYKGPFTDSRFRIVSDAVRKNFPDYHGEIKMASGTIPRRLFGECGTYIAHEREEDVK